MNILLITPQLPYPPRQGATIRNFNLLRSLSQRHTVDLLSFAAPGDDETAPSILHTLARRVHIIPQPERGIARRGLDTLTQALPDMALRLESAPMYTALTRWLDDGAYDIVQTEGIELAQYGQFAADRKDARSRPLWIFDNHNCEYLLQKRAAVTDLKHRKRWLAGLYSVAQWQKLVRYERRICRNADVVLAVSRQDASALAQLSRRVDVQVIVNGIEMEEFRWSPPRAAASPVLVFTGKMDYRPNIDAALWFGRRVLPLIQRKQPAIRFQIVGMHPHPRLDELRSNPAVEITGMVADTKPYIAAASVFVIPMRVGGGTRFKVLEAMALGAPIVSTTLGVEGIDVTPGEELRIGDTPDQFAAATLEILADLAQQGREALALSRAGRRFVEARFAWEQIIPQLEAVYRNALP